MKHPLVAAVVLALAAAPAAAETIDVVKASLAATRTMTADFTQTAANGSVATGTMVLARPGKIRFQYKRAPLLIVADGKKLSFVDFEVAQVSQWPIRSTPLGVLLDGEADLARFARIVGDAGKGLLVEARDPKHPEYGSITLNFVRDASAPGGLDLLGWTSRDAQNNQTVITLTNTRYNGSIGTTDFKFRDPRQRGMLGKG